MLKQPIGVYKFEDKVTVQAGTTHTFEGPEVKRGTIVVIHHGSVIDYSAAGRKLCLGRKDGSGEVHYVNFRKQTNISQVHLNGWMILLPSEKPIGVVMETKAGEVLYCSFYGLVYKQP